jgi:PAS domain S-box-containing protein
VLLVALTVGGMIWRAGELRRGTVDYLGNLLGATAEQNAHIVETWLHERRADAHVVALNAASDPELRAGSPRALALFSEQLTHVVGQYGYAAGWATDTAGRAIVASRDAGTLTSAEQAAATQAVREGRESIVGPLREPDGQLVLSFVEPVGVPSMRTSSAPWGAVVLRTDPARTLFTLISWKLVASHTGQARLIGRVGDEYVILSPSPFPAAAPLRVRVPWSQAPRPERDGIHGIASTGTFRDVRGVAVIGAVRPIAGTKWALVRTIDEAESLAETSEQLRTEVLLAIAVLGIVALVVTAAFRRARLVQLKRDVSGRRRAEEALRESEERFRGAFDHAATGMSLTDPKSGRWLRVNRALCEMVGYSEEELLASDFQSITHPDDIEPNNRLRAALMAGKIPGYRLEKRYFHRKGHVIWVVVSVSLVRDATGVPTYVVAQIQDITERKHAEAALRESEAQLRQAQKMEAVGQLAGGIAHDFNNLLTAISTHVEFALDALPPVSEAREELTQVQRAGARAASLTRQLLAFSRRQTLQLRVVDLNAIVLESERMLRRIIGENITFLSHVEPALPTVRADPGQLEQVLVNLVVNARDAMPDGGTLTIATCATVIPEAGLAARPGLRGGKYACLSVGDTGLGMDEEVRARVFEPFFTTKPVGQGTGLGLATVYGIVKQSGGYVYVDSTPGSGSTFTVYLPAIAASVSDARRDGAPRETIRAGTETILVVEDEGAVRSAVRRTLTRYGYAVIEASNGREALELVEARQNGGGEGQVELVITDVIMPELGGYGLIEQLRARWPTLRALFISGYAADEIDSAALRMPGTAFLEKPFLIEQLIHQVRTLLDGASGAASN